MPTPCDTFATERHSPKQLRLVELLHRLPLRSRGHTPATRNRAEALPVGYPNWELPHEHRKHACPSAAPPPNHDAASRRHQYTSRT